MMRAMVLHAKGEKLREEMLNIPSPGCEEVLIRISACAVCRTDLHVVDGDLTEPMLPITPGHEIVGVVQAIGPGCTLISPGDFVGVPWLGYTCNECDYCKNMQENLCDKARFTGYQIQGGFAEFCVANERFCFRIPDGYPDLQAAPLLCAGLIGYRSYRMTGSNARRLGLYGFGASAHLTIQIARYEGKECYAFTRPGDSEGQAFARSLGAVWAGGSDETPPEPLDAAIIFAPVGPLVPLSLKAVRKGGVVVCAGIHMSDIPSFPYSLLWEERIVRSVANLTRQDGMEFLALAPKVPVKSEVQVYSLSDANAALDDLRSGKVTGAAVLQIST